MTGARAPRREGAPAEAPLRGTAPGRVDPMVAGLALPCAIGLNVPAVAWLFTRSPVAWTTAWDGRLTVATVLVELGLVVVGIVAARGRLPRVVGAPAVATLVALLPLVVYINVGNLGLLGGPARPPAEASAVGTDGASEGAPGVSAGMELMEKSESLLLSMHPQLDSLRRDTLDLRLPHHRSRGLFAAATTLTDLATGDAAAPFDADPTFGFRLRRRPAAAGPPTAVARGDLDLWRPFFERFDWIDHAKIAVHDAHFAEEDALAWVMEAHLVGQGRLTTGETAGFRVVVHLRWERSADAPADESGSWHIATWETGDLTTVESSAPAFVDVLDEALPDPGLRHEARRSRHLELVLESIRAKERGEPFRQPQPRFEGRSVDTHPGVSIVDIDGDGWDDVYLMPRWGPNQLLRNRRDGTFEDVAPTLGLDVRGMCSSAVFADLDNDGDKDCFIGRSYAPSLLLVNEDGRFVDRSLDGPAPLPAFVSSVSAVDYDGDGLLDLYATTVASSAMSRDMDAIKTGKLPEGRLLADLLPEVQARALFGLRISPMDHPVLMATGPPNVLLHNDGGGLFSPDPHGDLNLFRQSYQATWTDYDGDGDPDVYVASDFSPNNLFRNDGGGRFTDVTAQTATADVGFGMGASWGDYDGDGRQDLYVSNMFSKAGRRITRQLEGIDERIVRSAKGNSLLRNAEAGFETMSGRAEPALLVEEAGWSWGSQFIDLDNDGDLDIYALSGHYTAPPEVELPIDS